MNEQIKALAQQAGESIPEFHFGDWNIPNEFIQKFALLIVRECIRVVDGMADPEEDSDRYVWALHNAIEKIREHFGVK